MASRVVAITISPAAWSQSRPEPDDADSSTLFPHADTDRYWLSGQANIIFQTHPPFRAPYSGDHSLRPTHEAATSTLLTLFTGLRVARWTELIVDVESAG